MKKKFRRVIEYDEDSKLLSGFLMALAIIMWVGFGFTYLEGSAKWFFIGTFSFVFILTAIITHHSDKKIYWEEIK